MSLNTAHANNGVLIHAGEGILIFCDNVTMEFSGQDEVVFKGTKQGRVYLTTHRMIFNNKKASDPMQSFSFPFVTLNDVQLEQPVFGANYIKGKVRAQENGNWAGESKFKLIFKHGGAIDYGQAMLRAAAMAQRNAGTAAPPPYTPPGGGWYAAPPPAYTPNPNNYGWVPSTTVFPDQPAPNSIYMHDSPPPYPGIITGPPQGYPQQAYPPQNGSPHPPQQPGNPMQNGTPGYGFTGAPGFSGAPAGAMGFTQPPAANSKEAEAAQSAYYDPNQPQTAYVPPPAYYEPPPSYSSLNKKNQ